MLSLSFPTPMLVSRSTKFETSSAEFLEDPTHHDWLFKYSLIFNT